jgi:hypothetical protein
MQRILRLGRDAPIDRVGRRDGLQRQQDAPLGVGLEVADGRGRQLARHGHPGICLRGHRTVARLVAKEHGRAGHHECQRGHTGQRQRAPSEPGRGPAVLLGPLLLGLGQLPRRLQFATSLRLALGGFALHQRDRSSEERALAGVQVGPVCLGPLPCLRESGAAVQQVRVLGCSGPLGRGLGERAVQAQPSAILVEPAPQDRGPTFFAGRVPLSHRRYLGRPSTWAPRVRADELEVTRAVHDGGGRWTFRRVRSHPPC